MMVIKKKYGIVIRESKVINHHSGLDDDDEVQEKQQLVVGTNTMPGKEWVKARTFAWMTGLLHFDKLLHVPLLILHKLLSVGFKELISLFLEVDESSPIISEVRSFFLMKATEIQNGGLEYSESKKWLNIWWPADEITFINICAVGKLDNFYAEAEHAMKRFMAN
ncbi:MAG: hypothetical protein L7F78_18940, partial [Syntrophales bacterium LBB04]|nr:hypothetical protein [Syntrophales bacterium LBB04]